MLRQLGFALLVGLAGAAHAFTVTSSAFDVMPAAGEKVVFDFNGDTPPAGFSFSGSGKIYSHTVMGAAQPAGDTTPFLAIGAGASETFTFAHSLTSFSIYIGSVNRYNFLEFTGTGYDSGKFSAATLPGGSDGNRTAGATNRRYFFTFAKGESIKTLTLSSTQPAFEVDNIALSPVPDPALWLLFAGGFGLVGVARRRAARRTVVA